MRLFKLELKRIIKTRTTLVIVCASIILPIILMLLVVSYFRHDKLDESGNLTTISGFEAIKEKRKVMEQINGELTSEKIEEMFSIYHEIYNKYGEEVPDDIYIEKLYPIESLLYRLNAVYKISPGEYRVLYETSPKEAASFYADRKAALESDMATLYPHSPSAGKKAVQNNEKVPEPFLYHFGYVNSDGNDYLVISLLLLAFACAVLTAPVFSGEYESGADDILRCTRHGRLRLGIVKVFAAMLVALVCFTIFISLYLLMVNSLFGWESLKTSVQLDTLFITNFVPLTVGEVQLAAVFAGLLSIMALVAFTLYISSGSKTSKTVLAIALLMCILPILLYYADHHNITNWIRSILPSGGIGLGNSFLYSVYSLDFLTIGDAALWTPYVMIITAAIEIPVFIILAIRTYCKNKRV